MQYQRFENKLFIRLDPGEEILEELRAICLKEKIALATIEGLGALSEFTAGVFDTDRKVFCPREFKGRYEITSLTGTVTAMQGEPYLHLHLGAANESGAVSGGHLSRAVISATGEIVMTAVDGCLERRFDEKIGLNLFEFF